MALRYHASLVEVQERWTVLDVWEANVVLDAYDRSARIEREIREAEANR